MIERKGRLLNLLLSKKTTFNLKTVYICIDFGILIQI